MFPPSHEVGRLPLWLLFPCVKIKELNGLFGEIMPSANNIARGYVMTQIPVNFQIHKNTQKIKIVPVAPILNQFSQTRYHFKAENLLFSNYL